jgi:hypothetical protein
MVDYFIATPAFQNAARDLDGIALRGLIAWAFIKEAIRAGFILRAEVEEYLNLPPAAESC